jgi:tRNA 2-thiouridine synthesizing protein A
VATSSPAGRRKRLKIRYLFPPSAPYNDAGQTCAGAAIWHINPPSALTASAQAAFFHNSQPKPEGESTMANFDQELDASGLNCPLPILRAKKALGGMGSGQVLRIIATDPGSVKDFEAFAKQTGNTLLSSGEEGGKFVFEIKKA